MDKSGSLYFTDLLLVRKISNGVIATVAGNGTAGFSGDNGPATAAQLNYPAGIALDAAGDLYIGDFGNCRVRMVSGGTITTVAGSGSSSGPVVSGPAMTAAISPSGISFDSSGSLYIADYVNQAVWQMTNGTVGKIAGIGASAWHGDALRNPSWVSANLTGHLYVGEAQRVREVSGGALTTVAGDGPGSYTGDNGPATSALLDHPFGVAVDATGALYIADTGENRVRKIVMGPSPR